MDAEGRQMASTVRAVELAQGKAGQIPTCMSKLPGKSIATRIYPAKITNDGVTVDSYKPFFRWKCEIRINHISGKSQVLL